MGMLSHRRFVLGAGAMSAGLVAGRGRVPWPAKSLGKVH